MGLVQNQQRLKGINSANCAPDMSVVTIKLCPFTAFKEVALKDFGQLLSHFLFYT